MTRQEKKRPLCPACRVGGYKQSVAHDGRPSFTCTSCDHAWTCGRDGGEYNLKRAEQGVRFRKPQR